ncbi:hypothetical protein DFH01_11470 [Falsiroseomonas bella]|uniref:DUF4214 domain-containing protein n=1 Tax=Falsiroseomonas bella TaxID=2184016 RepID=A0A317FIP9_9PROT|nr:DUF4214 domain-containing protein [Falsiroseomonas bella]PWS37446.1 hypothetical protein DFH01_11470 [Falsiroseomonas bella]
MLKGHIDSLTTADFVEGWAADDERPALRIEVIASEDGKVAEGRAHLFRADLADARLGLGWCAFRLRVQPYANALRRQTLTLRDAATGTVLHEIENCPIRDDLDLPCNTVEAAVASDPTVITSLNQLRGCQAALANFVTRRGVGEFVRAAYVYVLGRPVDAPGLASYGRMLRTGAITPFGLLSVLADSDEFRSRPRQLASPNATGFVFRV